MADSKVSLSVRSELDKVIEQLGKIRAEAGSVGDTLSDTAKKVDDDLNKQVKKTESFLDKLRSTSGRVADQLRGDFRSLLSVNALGDALKISSQFRGSIREAVSLSDAVRKLSRTFGIADAEQKKFTENMIRGLGEIGISSEAGAEAMHGLATSGAPVGQQSVLGYSKQAGMLASVTGNKGQEGDIAKAMAQVIQARGGDVNSMKEIAAVAEDVRRVFNATGTGAAETLSTMKDIFTNMSKDFREKLTSRGLANLSAAGVAAGPNATKFLEEMLGKSPVARQAMEAQGFKGVVSEKGIDIEKFRSASKDILSRVGGDPRLAAQTLGLSEEAAEGFIRLSDSLDRVKAAQDGLNNSTGNIEEQYRKSMGLSEAFSASINKIKGVMAKPMSMMTGGLTDALSEASQTTAGAGAVVAGGGVLAALLAGGALKGIGKGMGGGLGGTLARGAAAEAATGQKTIPVYVVNASEIGGGGAGGMMDKLGSVGGKAAGLLGKGGMIGAAAFTGYELGKAMEPAVSKFIKENTQGQTSEGFQGDIVERLLYKLDKLTGEKMGYSKNMDMVMKFQVEHNPRDLRITPKGSRGASQ